MRKPTLLFKKMQKEVDKVVKHYASDFEIDKNCIMGKFPESQSPSGIYYWYLRNSGTEIMSVENICWKETCQYEMADYWLNQAIKVFKVDVNEQKLTPISPQEMRKIISQAKDMPEKVKLDYILRRLEISKNDKDISPNGILYYSVGAFKPTRIDVTGVIESLINKRNLTYEEAIQSLTFIRGLAS